MLPNFNRCESRDSDGNKVVNVCPSKKLSWRLNENSFAFKLSNSIGPQKLARLIFWFAQKVSLKTLRTHTGIAKHSLSNACLWIRHSILTFIMKLQSTEILGGGKDNPNLVVLIDETFVTKKKRNKGGFQGRSTAGHTTIIIGFFELDISSEPRVGTGRTLLIIVPDRTRKTIEEAIRRYVRAGSIIWTDKFKSYEFLGAGTRRGTFSEISGYTWDFVNHSKGEFVRGAGLTRVSTNGVEGLFGRVKRFMRSCGVTKIKDNQYCFYLAEFLWRERFLSRKFINTAAWELPAVWLLTDLISVVHKAKYRRSIAGTIMTATNSDDLAALRRQCFPEPGTSSSSRPSIPAPPPPVPTRSPATSFGQ
jgi:hypothetical protein